MDHSETGVEVATGEDASWAACFLRSATLISAFLLEYCWILGLTDGYVYPSICIDTDVAQMLRRYWDFLQKFLENLLWRAISRVLWAK